MKNTSTDTKNAWLSGDYTGDKRPMTRVTVQKLQTTFVNYTIEPGQVTHGKRRDRKGKFATVPFGQLHTPLELPNLSKMTWSRSTDDPVATAELTFFNTDPLPLGESPTDEYTFDQPGWYTYDHGMTSFSGRWSYTQTGWAGLLAPDRILRTYEGYGFDADVTPSEDPNLYPSGVWMIDEVDYTADGLIKVTCRDLGRMLIEQICFPPVVPWAEYPMVWESYNDVPNEATYSDVGAWVRPKWQTDSNQAYIGVGFTDGGRPYVDPDGSVRGHHGRDAFDNDNDSYWLSVGNYASWSSAYEYVQGTITTGPVDAVRVKVFGGSYHGYISVKVDGEWKGSKKIPYVSRVVDTNADIPFVKAFDISENGTETIKLPKTYQNVEAVRITLSRLWNSGLGQFKYRGAIKKVEVSSEVSKVDPTTYHTEGNYGDYTDIVKWILAWGGWYWPLLEVRNFIKNTDGDKVFYNPPSTDPIFPTGYGRVWGDFMQTGTAGVTDLGVDVWDKKTLIDCIGYVRDIVGYLFTIGEDGGAIWRMPNIWAKGNYIWDPDHAFEDEAGPVQPSRTTLDAQIPVIDERQTLVDLTSKLSSRNMRERVFVGNVAGDFGAVAQGFRPVGYGDTKMRRVAGWTDQRFEDEAECQRMADLITLRQLFTYRENQLTIAANPAIQIDDQVKIYERKTNEGFLHYVKGVSSSWDLATGEWTYQLTTHWLGEEPFTSWAFNPGNLSEATQNYLHTMGFVS